MLQVKQPIIINSLTQSKSLEQARVKRFLTTVSYNPSFRQYIEKTNKKLKNLTRLLYFMCCF